MEKQLLKTDCCGCHACYNACPVQCITMEERDDGFLYPYIDTTRCIHCNKCEYVCPMQKEVENVYDRKAYAAHIRNEEQRMNSSSGAVFPLLSEYIISQQGCVYGAAFNSEFSVIHECVEEKKDLSQLYGTKYVQSKIGLQYQSVKEKLEQGKQVLFSGTPCQVAGLNEYLKKDYSNLFTVDLICHGVPSPGAWDEFLKCRMGESSSSIKHISFRDKEDSWENYSLKIEFQNGKQYRKNRREDLYLIGFLDDIYLRESCYACDFRGVHRSSDITLGDFWGIEKIHPHMADDKGISVIVINTGKGKQLLDKIKAQLLIEEVDIQSVEKYNPSYIESVPMTKKRHRFYRYYKKKSFDKAVQYAVQQSWNKRIKSYLYRILKER